MRANESVRELRKARQRGARNMVAQGLVLYYQSLVHRVHEDTPLFVAQVMDRARRTDRPSRREKFQVENAQC
jgi:hypothetical protein